MFICRMIESGQGNQDMILKFGEVSARETHVACRILYSKRIWND